MAYTTEAAIKAILGITDTARDAYITASLNAACQRIDEHCGRTFSLDTAVSARTFRARPDHTYDDPDGQFLILDADIGASAGVIVETGTSTAWNVITSDVELHPLDASAKSRPWTSLLYVGGAWPVGGGQRVRVTARWGWPSVPASVVQAATLTTVRLFKRKDSAEGAIGSADWGMIRLPRLDPDVQALLGSFEVAVG